MLEEADRVSADERFRPDRYVGLSLAADLAFDEGRVDEALELQVRAGDFARDAGDDWWRADTLQHLADRALIAGRVDIAGPAAREALRWSRSIADRQSTVYAMALLALEASATGRHDRAGRLWGGIQAEVDRGGPLGQWELEQESIRGKLEAGGDVFAAAVRAGRSMSLDDAVAEALTPG